MNFQRQVETMMAWIHLMPHTRFKLSVHSIRNWFRFLYSLLKLKHFSKRFIYADKWSTKKTSATYVNGDYCVRALVKWRICPFCQRNDAWVKREWITCMIHIDTWCEALMDHAHSRGMENNTLFMAAWYSDAINFCY